MHNRDWKAATKVQIQIYVKQRHYVNTLFFLNRETFKHVKTKLKKMHVMA